MQLQHLSNLLWSSAQKRIDDVEGLYCFSAKVIFEEC